MKVRCQKCGGPALQIGDVLYCEHCKREQEKTLASPPAVAVRVPMVPDPRSTSRAPPPRSEYDVPTFPEVIDHESRRGSIAKPVPVVAESYISCPFCGELLLDDGNIAVSLVQCPFCAQAFHMPGRTTSTGAAPANTAIANVSIYGGGETYEHGPMKSKRAHRGGLILTLALIGWFLVPILCVPAWIMGADDLKQMRAGRMDRSGEGMTQFGMIAGAIGTILIGIAVFLFLVLASTL